MSIYDKINLGLILIVIGYLLWNKHRWRVDINWDWGFRGAEIRRVGIKVWWWDKYHSQGNLVFRVPLRKRMNED